MISGRASIVLHRYWIYLASFTKEYKSSVLPSMVAGLAFTAVHTCIM